MAKKCSSICCPCGSGRRLAECCGAFFPDGAHPYGAPTPEALMASRYAAFALGREDYLLETWAVETRPERLFEPGEKPLKWFSLRILSAETSPDGRSGTVRFIAKARSSGGAVVLEETSDFRKDPDGRWRYVSGIVES